MNQATIISACSLAVLLFSAGAQARFNVQEFANGTFMASEGSCIINFDRHGERTYASNQCSRDDIDDAEDAVDDYRDSDRYDDDDDRYDDDRHSSRDYRTQYWEVNRGSDNSLRIRRKPSEGSDAVVKGVRNGTRLRGVDECERHNGTEWCEVEYQGDRGWVKKKYLRETSGGSGDHHGGHHNNNHNNDYGNDRGERFSDLVGARASSADSELRDRDFRNVESFKSGNTAYSIWYNRDTEQCLQMAVADGRADSIVDIKSHPKCD